MKQWVSEQWHTPLHLAAMLLYPSILFLSYLSPIFLYAGFAVFFLVTSIRLMWKMVVFMLIVGVVLAILPFLAPFAIILMIVLFILRIGYVLQNWRPFATGLLIYGSSVPLALRTEELRQWSGQLQNYTEPACVAVIGGVVLHSLLVWQYHKGYSTQRALGIMGSVPLIIIAFVLPFLKLHIGFGEAGPDFAHGGQGVGPDGHLVPAKGGDLVHVKTYMRTVPDGDPTNNLSYHGPDAKPVNPEDLQIVKAHDRTMPDSDPTNNLSYAGGPSPGDPGIGTTHDVPEFGEEKAAHQSGTVFVPPRGTAQPWFRQGPVLASIGLIGIIAALIWVIVGLNSDKEAYVEEAPAAVVSDSAYRYWIVTSEQANIRDDSSPDAAVLHVANQGTRLKFLEEQQADDDGRLWYKIEVEPEALIGWISSKIVEPE
jgi:hypothetical protein